MISIQEVFNEIREAKKELKELRAMYKDALQNADGYPEITEEIKEKKEKKIKIETKVQDQMGKSYEEMEKLKQTIAEKEEMLNDIAMTTLMKGDVVEVTDEFQNKYEPIYVVKFKKTNMIVSGGK